MGRNSIESGSHRWAQVVIAIFLSLSVDALAADAETIIDQLAAEVNGEPVTLSEILDKVSHGPLIEISPFPATEKDPPREVALQDLINFRLIMQMAANLDIEVSDEKLEEEIQKFLDKRKLDKEGLKQALRAQNMTMEAYRRDFREQLVLSQFQGRVIFPAIKLTEKDLEAYYLKTSGVAQASMRLELRQLLIAIRQDAPEAIQNAKSELARKAYQEIQDGMPFEQAVKTFSDDEASRNDGGKMPPLNLKDLNQAFQIGVGALDVGQVSKPIKTSNGIYIFKLEAKVIQASEDFQKQRNELEAALRQEEAGKQTIKWLEDQRRRSKIRIIASDNPPNL